MSSRPRNAQSIGASDHVSGTLAPVQNPARSQRPRVTIKDRLENGNLTIDEVCVLANRSRTGFYADLKAGLVTIRKVGRRSIVPGPVARRYIAGAPMEA
jgi:hypothetical protein